MSQAPQRPAPQQPRPAQSAQQEKDPKYRWDFSDMILAGKQGEISIVKHKHPKSDIDQQKTIQSRIYHECSGLAYGENAQASERGVTGQIQQHDFAYEFKDAELRQVVRFRVNVEPTTNGVHFCMRRINGIIPTLKEQGYQDSVITRLMHGRRRGLVLFSGEMGMGKTSAAAAMISEWLKTNGGTAITLEDPPEYNLQGQHVGKQRAGYCMQRQVQTSQMASEIPSLMRAAAPEIIFLGEIRSADVAREVVLAASNGHLVVSTIHGKGIEGAISRLISLSASSGFDINDAAKILGQSLSMVIYQELTRNRTENGFEKIISVTQADFMDEKKKTAFANIVSRNQLEQLKQLFGEPIKNKSSL